MNAAQEAVLLLKQSKAFKGLSNMAIEVKCGLGNGVLARCEKEGNFQWSTIEKLALGAGKKPYLVFKKDSK